MVYKQQSWHTLLSTCPMGLRFPLHPRHPRLRRPHLRHHLLLLLLLVLPLVRLLVFQLELRHRQLHLQSRQLAVEIVSIWTCKVCILSRFSVFLTYLISISSWDDAFIYISQERHFNSLWFSS